MELVMMYMRCNPPISQNYHRKASVPEDWDVAALSLVWGFKIRGSEARITNLLRLSR